jgi:hypothetical protein
MNNDTNNTPTQDNRDPDMEPDENEDGMYHAAQQPHLAEDGSTPFSPPTDIPGPKVSSTNPQTDTNIDSDEVYQEGLGSASGVTEQLEDSDWVQPIDEDADDEDRHARLR